MNATFRLTLLGSVRLAFVEASIVRGVLEGRGAPWMVPGGGVPGGGMVVGWRGGSEEGSRGRVMEVDIDNHMSSIGSA